MLNFVLGHKQDSRDQKDFTPKHEPIAQGAQNFMFLLTMSCFAHLFGFSKYLQIEPIWVQNEFKKTSFNPFHDSSNTFLGLWPESCIKMLKKGTVSESAQDDKHRLIVRAL